MTGRSRSPASACRRRDSGRPARAADPRPRRRRDAGFTLLELLVAMTLLAVLSLMMAGGLQFGTASWASATDRFAKADAIRIAQRLVRRQIAEALPMTIGEPGLRRAAPVAFEGRPDRVRFVGHAPARSAVPGYYAIEFAVEGDPGERRLVMSWRPLAPDLGDFESGADDRKAEKTTLLGGVEDEEFSYFGARRKGEAPGWHSSWTSRDALPRLVRVTLDTGADHSGPWSEVIVAPMVAAEDKP